MTTANPLTATATTGAAPAPPPAPAISKAAALAYRLKHHPSYVPAHPPGASRRLFPWCATPTGRYCPARGSLCDPCCEGRQSLLAPYGAGVTTFFKAEKAFIVLFLLLSLVSSIPMVWIAVCGNGQNITLNTLGLEATTLGNLVASSPNNPNGTIDVTLPFSAEPGLPGLWAPMTFAVADCLGALLLLAGWVWMRWGERVEPSLVGDFLSADMYSVFLEWVPPGADMVRMRDHFEALCRRLLETQAVQLADGWEKEVEAERERAAKTAIKLAAAAAASGMTEISPHLTVALNCRHVADCVVVEDNLALLAVYMRRGEVLRRFEALTLAIHRAEAALAEEDSGRSVLLPSGVAATNGGEGSTHLRAARGVGACGVRLCANQRGRLALLKEQREELARRVHAVTERALSHEKFARKHAAFVTFERPEMARAVLAEYDPSLLLNACGCQRTHLRFGRKTPLRVQRAPPPDTVIWTNLDTHRTAACARRAGTTLATLIVILVTFAGLFLLVSKQRSWEAQNAVALPPDCSTFLYLEPASLAPNAPDVLVTSNGTEVTLVNGTDLPAYLSNSTVILWAGNLSVIGGMPSEDATLCMCAQLKPRWASVTASAILADVFYASPCSQFSCAPLFSQSQVAASTTPWCADWLGSGSTLLTVVAVGASLVISTVNAIIAILMRWLTKLEKHPSTEVLNRSLVLRLAAAQFLVTVVLILLINAKPLHISAVTGALFGVDAASAAGGDLDDFSSGWYTQVRGRG